jgi:TonB family protein
MPLAYVVMEYAEENLGTVLEERALTAEETLEMLAPAAEALAFLHGRGYSHGRLRPSNIFAVNDTVKLSSDAISAGDTLTDMRAVGATTIQVLTRKPVNPSDSDSETSLVESLPPVFQEIVRNCAGLNGRRWSAAQLQDWLRSQKLTPGAGEGSTHASSPAVSTHRANAAISTPPARVGRPKAGKSKVTYYAVVFGLILVAVVTVGSILSHRAPDSTAPAPQASAKISEPAPAATPETPSPSPSPVREKKTAKTSAATRETTSTGPASGGPVSTEPAASAPATASDPATSGAPTASTDRAASSDPAVSTDPAPRHVVGASGDVVHEVIPEFTAKARRTVHGTVNVVVRVVADQSGHVTDATVESKGSPYFGKLLVQAARQWQFVAGNNADPREWFLRYQITRTDSKVSVEKSAQR